MKYLEYMKADERVVPGKTEVTNVMKHIARYNLALQMASGKIVADVACGVGYGSWLLSKVAHEVTGIDKNLNAILEAKKDYAGPIYFCADLTHEWLPYDEFELIVCFETIEHLEDLEGFMQQIDKHLKPGGEVIFSVPLNELAEWNQYHVRTFTLETASQLFPDYEHVEALIQSGINFYPVQDTKDRYNYYIGVVRKHDEKQT